MSTDENLSVLVVDDEDTSLRAIRRCLEDRGCTVTTVKSADEAREYQKQRFDIVIIDGLKGRYTEVYNFVDAGRKIIFSGDNNILEDAKKKGMESYDKLDGLDQIFEGETKKW